MHFCSFVCSKNRRKAHDERQYNDTKKPVLEMRAGFISNSYLAPSFHTNSLYQIKKYERYCNPTYKVV